MHITAVDSFILTVPVGQTMGDSMQAVDKLEFVGLHLHTDSGITGTGYTITVGHGGQVIKSVIDTLFADDLIGRHAAVGATDPKKLGSLLFRQFTKEFRLLVGDARRPLAVVFDQFRQ